MKSFNRVKMHHWGVCSVNNLKTKLGFTKARQPLATKRGGKANSSQSGRGRCGGRKEGVWEMGRMQRERKDEGLLPDVLTCDDSQASGQGWRCMRRGGASVLLRRSQATFTLMCFGFSRKVIFG
ncbi:hypothetical protein M413DRAFT_447500 [Hebeloma cylindrosporum]|uniref:Uncharacterized protein n=1 Tax=Hebeloma cylindrosporum TaxID=76867 RepID=A0A0C3BQ57_HEBCY|nr:hypothetical protein M413DRAFT_447500 [Hebeloma cylindrosporum h7]